MPHSSRGGSCTFSQHRPSAGSADCIASATVEQPRNLVHTRCRPGSRFCEDSPPSILPNASRRAGKCVITPLLVHLSIRGDGQELLRPGLLNIMRWHLWPLELSVSEFVSAMASIKMLRRSFASPQAMSRVAVVVFSHDFPLFSFLRWCAGGADFARVCRNLPKEWRDFVCFQSPGKDSGSAYRGSNPWGAANFHPPGAFRGFLAKADRRILRVPHLKPHLTIGWKAQLFLETLFLAPTIFLSLVRLQQ